MIIAIYKLNDKLLKTTNLEKKLKKLKKSKLDSKIQILIQKKILKLKNIIIEIQLQDIQ